MAKKKSFAGDLQQQPQTVLDVLINTEEPEAEVQNDQESLRTQGRKGMKLPRINLAFSQANYDFIRVMAGIKGQTLTQYINGIIDAERERSSEVYEKAKALVDSL